MSRRPTGPEPPDEPILSPDDGFALLARLIADDVRRGGGRGGAPAQPAPTPTEPGRRGRYKPRHPITVVMFPTTRRARAA